MTALKTWNEPRPVRLTNGDFLLLDRSGAFDSYGRTELIDGVIVAMNAQYRRHAYAKGLLARRLTEALEAGASGLAVLTEASVAMPPSSLPMPDIVVTSEPQGDGPVPSASVALLVEIADTTATFDLGQKARVYASAGVPEYWVLDLEARLVHQLSEQAAESYRQSASIPLGERFEALTIPGIAITSDGV